MGFQNPSALHWTPFPKHVCRTPRRAVCAIQWKRIPPTFMAKLISMTLRPQSKRRLPLLKTIVSPWDTNVNRAGCVLDVEIPSECLSLSYSWHIERPWANQSLFCPFGNHPIKSQRFCMSQVLFNSSGDLLSKFVHDMYSQSVLVALHVFSIPFSAFILCIKT